MRRLGFACGYWNYDGEKDGYWIDRPQRFISFSLAKELGWIIKNDSITIRELITNTK